jgi:DNA-binding beta-propeller fold protein YncE
MLAVAAAVGIVLAVPSCGSSSNTTSPQPAPHRQTTQVQRPFTGLSDPWGVAVDAAGNVYVTDNANHRVVELAAGSATPTVLPFSAAAVAAVAVDAVGDLYVTDPGAERRPRQQTS